jgi:two-component sensor histidine kinase
MTQYKGSQVPQNNESGDDAALAEANHRFANNLSLLAALLRSLARGIGNEGATMNRAEVQLLLQEASERIAAVGKLHALLSKRPRGPMVDLSDHLGQICKSLVSSLAFAGRVDLSLGFTTTCLVPTDQVVPLTLIVSEIITNAIKYAHPTGIPGKINLSAVREPGGILVIELSDDGVGLPEGFDPAKDGGFGLRVVRALG